jgi:hypothetical protein
MCLKKKSSFPYINSCALLESTLSIIQDVLCCCYYNLLEIYTPNSKAFSLSDVFWFCLFRFYILCILFLFYFFEFYFVCHTVACIYDCILLTCSFFPSMLICILLVHGSLLQYLPQLYCCLQTLQQIKWIEWSLFHINLGSFHGD